MKKKKEEKKDLNYIKLASQPNLYLDAKSFLIGVSP